MDLVTTNPREKSLLRQAIERLIDTPKQTRKRFPMHLIDYKEPTDRRCGMADATGVRRGK